MNNTTINLFNGLELINSLPKQLEYFNINTLPIQDKTIGGLSIAISILMGLLVIASFLLNIAIFITIITSYKLRSSLLYLMFSILSLLNLLDVLLITIIALLFVSNGGLWTFGKTICRVNAFAQQFLFLANLLILTLIAMERALSLIRRHLVTRKIFGSLAIVFMIIPLCFASPLLISGFPVSIYVYRYLCAIGSGSPVLYSIAQLLGCLFVLLICFGSIIKQSRIVRKLPVKPEHYGAFILENRILEEHMQLSKLIFWLVFEYAVIQGPYIFLDFFVQISNSIEVQLNKYTNSIISKEVDILVTIIKLFHPLIVPTMILVSCNNIWIQLIDKICCRCSKSVIVGSSNSIAIGGGTNSAFSQLLIGEGNNYLTNNPHVMTLYATPNGDLQLRLPNATLITQPPAQMVKSINKNDEINERIINKKNKKNFPSTQICTDIEEKEEVIVELNNNNNKLNNEKIIKNKKINSSNQSKIPKRKNLNKRKDVIKQ